MWGDDVEKKKNPQMSREALFREITNNGPERTFSFKQEEKKSGREDICLGSSEEGEGSNHSLSRAGVGGESTRPGRVLLINHGLSFKQYLGRKSIMIKVHRRKVRPRMKKEAWE